jgi:hypothetical protein
VIPCFCVNSYKVDLNENILDKKSYCAGKFKKIGVLEFANCAWRYVCAHGGTNDFAIKYWRKEGDSTTCLDFWEM